MAAAVRLLLGLVLAGSASVAEAQTYDCEVEAASNGGPTRHQPHASLDVHPAVALPGEAVVLRLRIAPSGYRGPEQSAFAAVAIRITNEAGETVLSRDDVLGSDGCIPGACEGLAEWSFVWNPERLPPGLYRAWAGADDKDGVSWPAVQEFLLREPLVDDAGVEPDPLAVSPGLVAGDTLDIPDPLVCRVEVSCLRVHPGETVQILLTATNPTGEPAQRFFPDHYALGYTLLDHDDCPVAAAAHAAEDLDAWLELAPGESIQRTWAWTWDADSVRPGRYVLRGGLGARGERESAPWVDLVLWRPSAFAFRLD